MQFRIIFSCFILAVFTCSAQDGQGYLTMNPSQDSTLFFLDSVETDGGMAGLSPDRIALINVVKGKKLQERYGARAANGVIYIETKPFARKRYNKMFGELSPAYAATLKQYGSDSSFQYILDGALLTNSIEPMLAALERKNIADITIIDPKLLKKQYKVNDKLAGVVIRSR
ncbi:hypothetical protein SAMN05518672_102224 [Chitinophaga sp. CF118]|uniref:hypothetical protein n=1 Tax=Chitinophaga sp. CF118 TaxID=1884367 RepID=UPI0008F2BB02|nr:hypothetical protein [Chitinophaga sp. CF118]SFD50679.1 hypothetical protein SAMN05518672_102224 [Chitinophaga sp. CF118]